MGIHTEDIGDLAADEISCDVVDAVHLAWFEMTGETEGDGICCGVGGGTC